MSKLKIAAAVLLAVGLAGVGVGLLARGEPAGAGGAAAPKEVRISPAKADEAAAKAAAGRIVLPVTFPPDLVDLVTGRAPHTKLIAIDPDTAKWTAIDEQGSYVRVSPDGRTLVFTRDKEVWTCDAQGKEKPRRVWQLDLPARPAWSPDAKQIVLTKEELTPEDHWKDETWRLNADGSGATRLPVPDTDAVSDWSADGRWFVTCSDRHPPRGRGYQLYVMHPDGTGQRRLTRDGLNCYARFSPDGRRLVYLHQERGVNTLRVVDVDGQNDRDVFKERDGRTPDTACWSPDGKRLAAVLIRRPPAGATDLLGRPLRETYHLEVMDADGGNRRELKLLGDEDVKIVPLGMGHPDWR